jgi:hypothetical protein
MRRSNNTVGKINTGSIWCGPLACCVYALDTGSSISESRHGQFPFPPLDLSCGCYSLSYG